jgi:hypothetical protein
LLPILTPKDVSWLEATLKEEDRARRPRSFEKLLGKF